MSKRFILSLALVIMVLGMAPLYAQGAGAAADSELVKWSIITGGFALAIAAGIRRTGGRQKAWLLPPRVSRAIRAQPTRFVGSLILGLVLIESLVIYVLLISLILFFIKPFGG